MGLFELGVVIMADVRGYRSTRGVVPEYPIGGYVGILGMAADRGEKGVSTGVKAEARLH